jgi:hypothetical protein
MVALLSTYPREMQTYARQRTRTLESTNYTHDTDQSHIILSKVLLVSVRHTELVLRKKSGEWLSVGRNSDCKKNTGANRVPLLHLVTLIWFPLKRHQVTMCVLHCKCAT